MDVRRCRRNALMHSAHDFSVFCPFDSVVPAQPGKLADFSWVELSKGERKANVNSMPYYGLAW
jgi:hypothetical protein